jgi:hypothetical protein
MAAQGVVDALTNTYTDIAKMKLLPDSQQHVQFLDGLMNGVLKYIQMQANSTVGPPGGIAGGAGGMGGMGGGMGAAPGMGGGGAPPTPPPGMGAPPPAMANAPGGGGGMTGLMGGANPDDLRRLLAMQGAGGGGECGAGASRAAGHD